jgi:hypothetical protein
MPESARLTAAAIALWICTFSAVPQIAPQTAPSPQAIPPPLVGEVFSPGSRGPLDFEYSSSVYTHNNLPRNASDKDIKQVTSDNTARRIAYEIINRHKTNCLPVEWKSASISFGNIMPGGLAKCCVPLPNRFRTEQTALLIGPIGQLSQPAPAYVPDDSKLIVSGDSRSLNSSIFGRFKKSENESTLLCIEFGTSVDSKGFTYTIVNNGTDSVDFWVDDVTSLLKSLKSAEHSGEWARGAVDPQTKVPRFRAASDGNSHSITLTPSLVGQSTEKLGVIRIWKADTNELLATCPVAIIIPDSGK